MMLQEVKRYDTRERMREMLIEKDNGREKNDGKGLESNKEIMLERERERER